MKMTTKVRALTATLITSGLLVGGAMGQTGLNFAELGNFSPNVASQTINDPVFGRIQFNFSDTGTSPFVPNRSRSYSGLFTNKDGTFSNALNPGGGFGGALDWDSSDAAGNYNIDGTITFLDGPIDNFYLQFGNVAANPDGRVSGPATFTSTDGAFAFASVQQFEGFNANDFTSQLTAATNGFQLTNTLDPFDLTISPDDAWNQTTDLLLINNGGPVSSFRMQFRGFASDDTFLNFATTTPVPEPSSALLGVLAGGLYLLRRRR